MICDTMIRQPEGLEQTIEAARAAVSRLSPIEARILDGIVEGNSSAGIASKLQISVEEVNQAVKQASEPALKGILEYTTEQLVSSDFNHNPASSIVDLLSTFVIADRMVKVMSWYDNEWGYSTRCVDLASFVAEKLRS